MTTYYDAKYPLGFNPFWVNLQAFYVSFLISFCWLTFGLITGQYSLKTLLILIPIPFIGLPLYKMYIDIKWGWIIKPLRNATYSLNMIYERRPIYRTIYGYNRIDRAPSFTITKQLDLDKVIITYQTNGCPNADADLASFLQSEMSGWTVVKPDNFENKIELTKENRGGEKLTNESFY